MFASITNWISSSFAEMDKQHNDVSWQEALDDAVQSIANTSADLESEAGKEALKGIIKELQIMEHAFNGGADPEQKANARVLVALPWEGLHVEQAKQLTREAYGLSADTDNLLATKEELEYEYTFTMDRFVVLAQILLKLDKNLKDIRHSLVPDMIEEDDFWRNYFY